MGAAQRLFKPVAAGDRLQYTPASTTGPPAAPCCRLRRLQTHVFNPRSDQLAPFLAGAKSCLPVLPGIISFGTICGAAMVASGLSKAAAVAMSLLVFAGTLQLAAVQLAATGAPLAIIALAGIVISLRFVIFSLSLSRYFHGLPAGVRAIYAYLMTDNAYAQAITRFTAHPDERGRSAYYFGIVLVIWAAWQASSIAGIYAGAAIPREWQLEFTVSLTFIALGVANMRDRASALAALAAGVTAVLAAGLPYRIGLILGAGAGVTVGMLTEKWMPSPSGR
jgi:predicted branched-subunit amino acid permease